MILQQGDYNHDELFGQVKKGLWISNVWYTRFQNYAEGQFSTIPRDGAFYMENGEVKYPIKGIRVSENVLNMMKNIIAIGKEPKKILSWEVETPVETPFVVVKDVRVTKPIEKG